MALIPQNDYAGQIATGDPAYPHGKARNVTVSGDGTGTPLEASWVNDIWGFLQNLLAEGGVTPTGTPDGVGASQYLDALKAILPVRWVGRVITAGDGFSVPTTTTLWGPAPISAAFSSGHSQLTWGSALVDVAVLATGFGNFAFAEDRFANVRIISSTVVEYRLYDLSTGTTVNQTNVPTEGHVIVLGANP